MECGHASWRASRVASCLLASAGATVMNMKARTSHQPPAPLAIVVAITVATLLAGCTPSRSPEPAQTPTASEAPTPHLSIEQSPILNGHSFNREQAVMTLDVLGIKAFSMAGYSADKFQIDADASAADAGWEEDPGISEAHCTVAEAALVRDGHDLTTIDDSCKVTSGLWLDPLNGKTLAKNQAQIKGFLPPQRVWASGGDEWSNDQFRAYRDSPQSVLTISNESYEDRHQKGPADWKPKDERLWCGYALRWVSEKNTFGLYMEDQDEADALTEMLQTCPDSGFVDQSI